MNKAEEIFNFLTSKKGEEILIEVTHLGESEFFSASSMTLLSRKKLKTVDPALLNICIEIVCCRNRLMPEYPWASKGFFHQQGVEQKTSQALSTHHAKFFSGVHSLCEIGTGLGFDTLEFSRVAEKVTSFDTNLLTVLFARHNLSVQGISNVDICHGEEWKSSQQKFDGYFADPSRRTDRGERIKDPEQYSPSLSSVLSFFEGKLFGIKVSPLVIPPKNFEGGTEWLGDGEDLKELVLWGGKGSFKRVSVPSREFSFESEAQVPRYLSEIFSPPFYLVEPHSSIIGSLLYPQFFASQGLHTFDSGVSYGVSKEYIVEHSMYRRFKIEEVMPLRIPDILKRSKVLDLGRETEVKKRGVEIDPNDIQKKLSKDGSNKKVIFLTRHAEKKVCLIGERI